MKALDTTSLEGWDRTVTESSVVDSGVEESTVTESTVTNSAGCGSTAVRSSRVAVTNIAVPASSIDGKGEIDEEIATDDEGEIDDEGEGDEEGELEARARRMAEMTCEGFIQHDARDRDAAVEAFAYVDERQFPHLTPAEARSAAEAFVDSLWGKDAVESEHIEGDGPDDFEGLQAADWSPVEDPLIRRAEIVGMDEEYAPLTTEAWRKHKVGGDYWTPTMIAQQHEILAAMGKNYPEKPRFGQSGFGHLASLYLVGVELHDMHTEYHWKQAMDVMTTYYAEILAAHEESH